MFDTLNVFGDTSEEVAQKSKYAKWRAAYITRCIKNGETPLAPEDEGNGDEGKIPDDVGGSSSIATTSQDGKPNSLDFPTQPPSNIPGNYYNQYPGYYPPPPGTPIQPPYTPPSQPNPQVPTSSPYVPPSVPTATTNQPTPTTGKY